MATYEPASRRPISDTFRATASLPVQWCVRHGVHPNLSSISSILASGLAGVCLWQASARPWLLLPAVGLGYFRLWLNMLDGMVAIEGGTSWERLTAGCAIR